MNNFWCGLHFLVGLSDKANTTLSMLEDLVHDGSKKIGAPSLPDGFNKLGESGTVRLLRTICKSVQDRGCEKSGKPVEFRDHLHKSVPLAPFKGNRFNILFHNAAGAYHLREHLRVFMEQHACDNRLMKAVHADLQVKTFRAGIRALGLIGRLMTLPLWREIVKECHVLTLSRVFQQMCGCFEAWAEDSTPVLQGRARLFEGAHQTDDHLLASLCAPDVELDLLTKQMLEVLFSAFLVVVQGQLKDCLDGGKYADPDNLPLSFWQETTSVPNTNIGPERIFSQLDRLVRLMPAATTIAMEGITMWSLNHTAQWLHGLDQMTKAQLMERARRSKQEQRVQYLTRLTALRAERELRRSCAQQKVICKEQKERVKREKLMSEMNECGSLCVTSEDVDARMQAMTSDREKRRFLELQLKARRYIICSVNRNGILNLSTGGRTLPLSTLAANLKCSIMMAADEAQDVTLRQTPNPPPFLPLSDVQLQAQKNIFKELALKESRKKHSVASAPKLPVITSADDLVGKRVRHLCEEDGQEVWFLGIVKNLVMKRGVPKYTIKYDDSDTCYQFPLFQDLKKGDLELVSLDGPYLQGKTVDHRFKSPDDGMEYWYTGNVQGYDPSTGKHTIQYEYCTDDEEDDDEGESIFEEPLLKDYIAGDVRIIV